MNSGRGHGRRCWPIHLQGNTIRPAASSSVIYSWMTWAFSYAERMFLEVGAEIASEGLVVKANAESFSDAWQYVLGETFVRDSWPVPLPISRL